jgi:hypothetical protein
MQARVQQEYTDWQSCAAATCCSVSNDGIGGGSSVLVDAHPTPATAAVMTQTASNLLFQRFISTPFMAVAALVRASCLLNGVAGRRRQA